LKVQENTFKVNLSYNKDTWKTYIKADFWNMFQLEWKGTIKDGKSDFNLTANIGYPIQSSIKLSIKDTYLSSIHYKENVKVVVEAPYNKKFLLNMDLDILKLTPSVIKKPTNYVDINKVVSNNDNDFETLY